MLVRPRRSLAIALIGLVLVASQALAQVEPEGRIYAARTPLDTPLSLPYSLLILPGDGTNTISLVQPPQPLPAHGTLSFPAGYDGSPGQAFLYTPNPGYVGIDQFYYKVTDGTGDISIAIVTLNVGGAPATAEDDNLFVGGPDEFLDILFNDLGFADPVSFRILQPPQHGQLVVELPDPLWQGYISILYTPNPGYNGPDQFEYEIGDGIDLDTAIVSLTVSQDSDGDDVLDVADNCPAAVNPGQEDADGDGRGNHCDNCRLLSNAAQIDSDNDGFGNRCDADFNNTGAVNAADLALFRGMFGTVNPVGDLNSSGGAVNAGDLAIFRALFGAPPGPGAQAP
jgi:Bacterial Ig domain/Thrombospondin type 3 repeat